jgi:hypothetical protein
MRTGNDHGRMSMSNADEAVWITYLWDLFVLMCWCEMMDVRP